MLSNDNPALQLFADGLPFGVYVVDAKGRLVVWNRAAERITGYTALGMVGRAFDPGLLIGAGTESVEECRPGAGAESCAEQRELYFRHALGYRVPVRTHAMVLRSEQDGAIVGRAGIFQAYSPGDESLHWLNGSAVRLDAELGIAAEDATEQELRLCLAQERPRLAVLLVSIEELNVFERRCGSEMVNVTLRAVAQTISRLLTVTHFFGRWTNRRFLLLVSDCDHLCFEHLRSKLENLGSACEIRWWGDRFVPHVRVAGTYAQAGDDAEALLRRLERDDAGKNGATRCL